MNILYTDNISIVKNEMGVVIHFMQHTVTDNEKVIVASVGMSNDAAKALEDELRKQAEKTDI